jgi:hypothetical protein
MWRTTAAEALLLLHRGFRAVAWVAVAILVLALVGAVAFGGGIVRPVAVVALLLLALVLRLHGLRGCVAVGITIPVVALVGIWVLMGLDLIEITEEQAESERYASIEEAEQVAGFHIPRAGREYPVSSTYLTWYPGEDRPESDTCYDLPGAARRSFSVKVGPYYHFHYAHLGGSIVHGQPMTMGGRSGRMVRDDEVRWRFAFECGSVDDVTVWCEVRGDKDQGLEALEAFIASIH